MGDSSTTPPSGDDRLKKDAISASGIVFLVLAAASPLIGLTGRFRAPWWSVTGSASLSHMSSSA
jgi:hypothetical protein